MKDQYCSQCGSPRQENLKFCTVCGFDFRDRNSNHIIAENSEIMVDVHPWRRYWARVLDHTILGMIFSLIMQYISPLFWHMISKSGLIELILHIILFLFFSVLLESACISYMATTPGKALFKIKIKNQNGSNLNFGKSMDRSCLAYMKGMAIGFFPISLIFEWRSKQILEKNGVTQWDAELKTVVQHGSVGHVVYFYFIMITIFLIFANAVLKRMVS